MRSLLNCCSPHNFQFLDHDFPCAGGGGRGGGATGTWRPHLPIHRRRAAGPLLKGRFHWGSSVAIPWNRTPTGAGASGGRPHAVHPSNYPVARRLSPNPNRWRWSVSPQIPMLKPSPQGDGVRRRGLWEAPLHGIRKTERSLCWGAGEREGPCRLGRSP